MNVFIAASWKKDKQKLNWNLVNSLFFSVKSLACYLFVEWTQCQCQALYQIERMLDIKVEHIFLNFPKQYQVVLAFRLLFRITESRYDKVLYTRYGCPTVKIQNEWWNLTVPPWLSIYKRLNFWRFVWIQWLLWLIRLLQTFLSFD